MSLVLASTNVKKHAELTELLAPLGVEVLLPDQVGGLSPVEEDGMSFGENAAKKAVAAARETRRWALADDSGLEVAALDGAPGIRSARYSGAGATDARNNEKLLRELDGVPEAARSARFVCALALAAPDGEVRLAVRGTVAGRILSAPRGDGGFGYDPLFLFTEPDALVPPGRTFAELSSAEKGRVSHRGRALEALAAKLPGVLDTAADGTPETPTRP